MFSHLINPGASIGHKGSFPGRVLRYNSDGEAQIPFGGLKFVI